uniref:Uncharacterized protein n=1 Tax=Cacopsylla melanoneura TaxID=428564 RepID=A0A8D8ZCM9_9HEMI
MYTYCRIHPNASFLLNQKVNQEKHNTIPHHGSLHDLLHLTLHLPSPYPSFTSSFILMEMKCLEKSHIQQTFSFCFISLFTVLSPRIFSFSIHILVFMYVPIIIISFILCTK